MSARHSARGSSAALILLLASLAGCHHTVRVGAAPVGDAVVVSLPTPRTLPAVSAAGDTVRLEDVSQVTGRVSSTDDDAIVLRSATAADAAGQRIAVPAGARVIVPRGAGLRIEQRRVSVPASALATFGIILGVFALGIALGGGGP